MRRAALPAAALLVSLTGCASAPPLRDSLSPAAPAAFELVSTPFFPQEEHHCGPAALATVLTAAGVTITPGELATQVFIPDRRGSLQAEMLGAARRAGLMPYVLPPLAGALPGELTAGRPVVVLQNLGVASRPLWHYAVLVGYDAGRGVVLLRSGRDRRLEMRWWRFLASWERGGSWAFTVLQPGEIPEAADAGLYLEAAAGLEAAGRLHAATAAYRAATARWPDMALAWLGLGNAAYARGELTAAVEAFAAGIRVSPDNPFLRNNLAQALADAGCGEGSVGQAQAALRLARGTALEATVQETLMQVQSAAAAGTGRCDPELLATLP